MQPDRTTYFGGSDAGPIMRGEWLDVWNRKTRRPQPDDLSGVFRVQLGSYTESFNVQWFQKPTGIEVQTGQPFKMMDFRGGTVDGLTEDGGILECKHSNQWKKPDAHIRYYYWQCMHYLSLYPERTHVWLSVIGGNDFLEPMRIERNEPMIDDLLRAEKAFWHHVQSDTSPADGIEMDEPEWEELMPHELKTVCMDSSNAWAHNATTWLANQESHKAWVEADKEIKEIVKSRKDVGTAIGHGIRAAKNKRGAVSITKEKEIAL